MMKRMKEFANRVWQKIYDRQIITLCSVSLLILILVSFTFLSGSKESNKSYQRIERFSTNPIYLSASHTDSADTIAATNSSLESYQTAASYADIFTDSSKQIEDQDTSLQTPSTDNPEDSLESIEEEIARDNILAVNTSIGDSAQIVLPHDEFGNVIDESGNIIDEFGNVIDEFGNIIDESGNAITDSDSFSGDSDSGISESASLLDDSDSNEVALSESIGSTNEKKDPNEPVGTFKVKSDVNLLNMRETPNSNATIVAKLTSISRGTVLSYDENWAHVKTTNYEGYVATQFIVITDNE